MDIEEIIEKIKNLEVKPIGVKQEYSVLLPLIEIDGELHIIYELRAKDMDTQPGEVSFPGGRVEEGETYEEAAIRETMEELNIAEDKIELIGELHNLVSLSGLRIHCFLGYISQIDLKTICPNIKEVDHIFTVPLSFFLENEPDKYIIGFKRLMNNEFPYNLIPNGREYDWRDMEDVVYFYNYQDYVIWGFTAKMTKAFIEIIKKTRYNRVFFINLELLPLQFF